ncbi:nitrilase-related carbon-nitrogen hydrolase [Candidatus Berkiella aquae]|uniref:CN hydrolase domain-containing protein n=3 Tax=Candidatus Berkiella aquae TaxID=295108 RepID=A0AAE3HU05_9GAMM|nr:nitrilase-related carbon-nitrogen hydrolase [Candidatus Berkiella aquae]MCS5710602.1 hypothetical protein [Candidatus Berkiella aquae]
MIIVATTQYAIESALTWEQFIAKHQALVKEAKSHHAQLLLLPEYMGIEVSGKSPAIDLELFQDMQYRLPHYLNFFQQLAIDNQLYIQPGTIMVEVSPQRFANRAYFFSPSGSYGYQDKLQLTASEKSDHLFMPGTLQTLFKTTLGLVGIAVCYDSEFPEIVRNLTLAGAKLILVPSYCPSLTSLHRVYFSCRARALENQCYVLTSHAVSQVKFGNAVETLSGQVGLFGPVDQGFPVDGIIVQGKLNHIEMILGQLDFAKLDEIRTYGQVQNFLDSQQLLSTELIVSEL